MNLNKILLAGLVGGIVSFFLGWIIYGMLLSGVMEAESTNNIARPENEMIFWAMILANLSYGMLYAYIFGRWAGITNWMTGAQAGAIIGLLMGMFFDLLFYGTSNVMTLKGVFIDIVVFAIMAALTGAIVAFVLGYGKKQ